MHELFGSFEWTPKVTFEQLLIFVAVAERQHLTKAAAAIRLTPSAVSASIKALEASYNVKLFERVGRGIELTQSGSVFLAEAKAVLSRANSAALVLSELGGLKRGVLGISASRTVASYWLPPRLMRFHQIFPNIELRLKVDNTRSVARSVREGRAEIGFIEGNIDEAALAVTSLAVDEMVIVVAADHYPAVKVGHDIKRLIGELCWVMREEGSGTRSHFEAALKTLSFNPDELNVAMVLPSNEAVLCALPGSRCAATVSRMAAMPMIAAGGLRVLDVELPPRAFTAIRHKQRTESAAARELRVICASHDFCPSAHAAGS